MNTSHTPGPWDIIRLATPDHSPQFGIYAGDNPNNLATIKGDNSEANARLIAAAPDLLRELNNLLATARLVDAGNKNQYGRDCHGFAKECFDTAATAIAKATSP